MSTVAPATAAFADGIEEAELVTDPRRQRQILIAMCTALIAVANLADIVPARALYAVCAMLAAGANAALLGANGYGVALVTRFATGACLAGVYPPVMKMAATWFRARRGRDRAGPRATNSARPC